MSNGRNWKSTKGAGDTWNPKQDAQGNKKDKAEESDYIEGYYVEIKHDVGQHNSSVMTIETDEGKKFNVWLDTVLGKEIEKIRLGQYIMCKWLGPKLKKSSMQKKQNQLRDTDFFHDWEVMIDLDAEPIAVIGSATQDPATRQEAVQQGGSTQNSQQQPKKEQQAPRVSAPISYPKGDDSDDLPF